MYPAVVNTFFKDYVVKKLDVRLVYYFHLQHFSHFFLRHLSFVFR